jgi:hypothetical protein
MERGDDAEDVAKEILARTGGGEYVSCANFVESV